MRMKYVRIIAGILLGLCFLAASIPVLFHLVKMPDLPAGTPVAKYMDVMGSTGYLTFIKVFELVGGLIVMIPRLRNIGLLVLGPIIVNIIRDNAIHQRRRAGLGEPDADRRHRLRLVPPLVQSCTFRCSA
jgi:putative oxidoreductase